MITAAVIAIVVAVALYAIVIYNGLVKKRQMVEEGWSGIDVQLKRRSNLIPNLLESVKGYMGHERELLEKITELRASAAQAGDAAERGRLEGALSGALGRLFAVAENYPDLKANQNFLDFQNALEEIEGEIQMSRRYYNGAVRNLNVQVESFPSNLVANQFNFEKAEFFELENPEERAVPKVSF
ncbi:MAG: LemA family protein [Hyphomicrobiales bacterium]|nr:LemA family protein [Hyphomicrobiales bacterium]